MMKKRLMVIALSLLMVFGVVGLAACGKEEEKPISETITKGIWQSDEIAGSGGKKNYVAFNTNGIFYHSMMNNGMSQAGYWELVEEEYEFDYLIDYKEGVDAYHVKGTAKAYVKLTNFDGSVFGNETDAEDNKFPILNNKLYRIWYDDMAYGHLPDEAHSASDETAKEIVKFIKADDASEVVTIAHNGATVELGDDFVEKAAWTYDKTNKKYSITIGTTTVTLTVAADGKSAVYKAADGTEIDLVDPDSLGAQMFLAIADTSGSFSLDFYNDGSYKATAGGGLHTLKSGTWSIDMTAYKFTVDTTEIQITGAFNIVLNLTTSQGAADYTFAIAATDISKFVENQPVPAVEILAIFDKATSGTYKLSFYNDGTYEMIVPPAGNMMAKSGTWSWEAPAFLNMDTDKIQVTGTPLEFTLKFDHPSTGAEVSVEFSIDSTGLTTLQNNGSAE